MNDLYEPIKNTSCHWYEISIVFETESRMLLDSERPQLQISSKSVRRGHGGLVVRSRIQSQSVPDSIPDPTEDPHYMWLCTR
ncbi:hypothetical protein AVEN_111415-1 [Araneus ventricosus]|uniref:Uncharacterized protein n=1 Tax=Araneus ventricosus TaxID=182803 RepID=A0A4Y2K2J0_ARAVE|nr:hypothetical protein AVEN_111415-1 [Araneus ventricosus]